MIIVEEAKTAHRVARFKNKYARNKQDLHKYERISKWATKMPSGAVISRSIFTGVIIQYPCGTQRWISHTYFNDVDTDKL